MLIQEITMSNNSLTDIIASFLGEIISSSYNVFAGTFLISFLYILVMNESQPNFLILIGNVSFSSCWYQSACGLSSKPPVCSASCSEKLPAKR